jgi:hypothetical protein
VFPRASYARVAPGPRPAVSRSGPHGWSSARRREIGVRRPPTAQRSGSQLVNTVRVATPATAASANRIRAAETTALVLMIPLGLGQRYRDLHNVATVRSRRLEISSQGDPAHASVGGVAVVSRRVALRAALLNHRGAGARGAALLDHRGRRREARRSRARSASPAATRLGRL